MAKQIAEETRELPRDADRKASLSTDAISRELPPHPVKSMWAHNLITDIPHPPLESSWNYLQRLKKSK